MIEPFSDVMLYPGSGGLHVSVVLQSIQLERNFFVWTVICT